MSLKLVPFNSQWINHDKIDIKAIYRRPRFKKDEFDEDVREYKDGIAQWDLTGPLPVKQHVRWQSKGFEYVTLADRSSLMVAASTGTLLGEDRAPTRNFAQFDQHQSGGPWNYKKYLEGQAQNATAQTAELEQHVRMFGWQAVETIKRSADPGFTMPDELKQPHLQPGAAKVKATTVSMGEAAKSKMSEGKAAEA